MSDYIKREDAIDALYEECNKDQSLSCPYQFFDGIERIPAADVRANIHGKWIVIIEKDADGNGYYNCSVCGAGESHVPSYTVSYCWNCGARMNGGDER